MSTIIAVIKNGRIIIGADTLISQGPKRRYGAHATKILRYGDMVFATAGLSVYYAVLQRWFDRRPTLRLRSTSDVFAAFVRLYKFMRSETHFEHTDWEKDDPCPFADLDAEFVVACPSGLYTVAEVLSVNRYDRYCAIGSGADVAEGALEALYDRVADGRALAQEALEIAEKFDSPTARPFVFETVPLAAGRRPARRSRRKPN